MNTETEPKRGPGRPRADEQRPDMRPEMRADDPRERARKRAEEIRQHNDGAPEGKDEFIIDRRKIPQGWDYEWKTETILGKEDPAYQVQLAQAGWEPVPADRHPEMMPKGYKGATITRKGMILMERPMELTHDARDADLRRARAQVRQKEEQLNAAPQGHFERTKQDGTKLSKINKHYEPMPIPES